MAKAKKESNGLPTTFWDIEVTVNEVVKNEKNKIVVKNVSKDGKDYVDVRNYYMDKEGNWKHGKGLSIPMELAGDISDIIGGAVKEGLPF
jgi:hypothetical protein